MSGNPNPESRNILHRFSTRTIMAAAIGVLVLTLSLGFDWFRKSWDFYHHRVHHRSTTQMDEENRLVVRNGSRIFTRIDSPPQLIGGLDALERKIYYPEIAKNSGVEGRVFLQFVVDRNGRVSEAMVTRGIGGGCDDEAIRALNESRFVPGTIEGVPVRMKMSLPVSFRLN